MTARISLIRGRTGAHRAPLQYYQLGTDKRYRSLCASLRRFYVKTTAWRSVLLLILLVSIKPIFATADEFQLTKDGIGPINVSMEVHVRNAKDNLTAFPRQVAELTASARNDSGQPIRYAKFCVQAARRMKGCDFQFSIKRAWET